MGMLVKVVCVLALWNSAAANLQQVVVVFRHGERTPASTYKNDIYSNEKFFPYGWGQLTNIGKLHQYEQGKWLREKYQNFLGEVLTPTLIKASSTDVARARMSLSLMLAGLMPPTGPQAWSKELFWQPFPWVSTGEHIDKILLARNCPRIQEAIEEVEKSAEVIDYNQKHKELYDYLTEHTGEKVQSPLEVFDIFGTLTAEKDYGLQLPEWTKTVFPEKMAEVSAKRFIFYTQTEELKKLNGGPLVKEIMESFKTRIEKRQDPKMVAYAGHDSTIAYLMRALGVWDEQVPSYNIMAIFELHEPTTEKKDWTIKVMLKNSTSDEPHVLQLPGCKSFCPFPDVVRLTAPIIPNNLEEECKYRQADFKPQRPELAP